LIYGFFFIGFIASTVSDPRDGEKRKMMATPYLVYSSCWMTPLSADSYWEAFSDPRDE
jgi:hypothetical protein